MAERSDACQARTKEQQEAETVEERQEATRPPSHPWPLSSDGPASALLPPFSTPWRWRYRGNSAR
eukprot:8814505-Pyramimonas_sp.AAC.1